MWKCSKCSEQIEEALDVCWNCGTSKDGSPPTAQFVESRRVVSEAAQPLSHRKQKSDSPDSPAQTKYSSIVFTLLLVALGIALVWHLSIKLSVTPIGTLLNSKGVADEVWISGRVTETQLTIGAFAPNFYVLADESGTILVIPRGPFPKRGEKVTVKGRLLHGPFRSVFLQETSRWFF